MRPHLEPCQPMPFGVSERPTPTRIMWHLGPETSAHPRSVLIAILEKTFRGQRIWLTRCLICPHLHFLLHTPADGGRQIQRWAWPSMPGSLWVLLIQIPWHDDFSTLHELPGSASQICVSVAIHFVVHGEG